LVVPVNKARGGESTIMNPYTELKKEYASSESEDTFRQKRNSESLKSLREVPELHPDPILRGVLEKGPEFDTRHNLGIVSRPPKSICQFIERLQSTIISSISNSDALFPIPESWLHLTALEICHAKPADEVEVLAKLVAPALSKILEVADSDLTLYKPMVSFDQRAVALSFISKPPTSQITYREALFNVVQNNTPPEVSPSSRYSVPSAHVTMIRFIDKLDPTQVQSLISTIQSINRDIADAPIEWEFKPGTSQCHYGRTWYGKGTVITL
jgi:hypothetical protein